MKQQMIDTVLVAVHTKRNTRAPAAGTISGILDAITMLLDNWVLMANNQAGICHNSKPSIGQMRLNSEEVKGSRQLACS